MNWDDYFLQMAVQASSRSKDPSVKVGAVIARPDHSVASTGYNGFPIGMKDDPSLYTDRDTKYSRVIHAEMNAILFCRDILPLTGYTLYTTAPCCERCAVHMIQVGIRRFVSLPATAEQMVRWNTSKTIDFLKEVGAEYIIK